MITILLPIVALISGFVLLIWSSDKFSDSGTKIANIFKISPFIIGIVIFGFGTSAPEMMVSVFASMNGKTELSIGNAIGSNIFNIALVLGVSALIVPLKVNQTILKKEWLFLMLVTIIAGGLLWDQHLGEFDGLILFSLLIAFLIYVFKQSKHDHTELDDFGQNANKNTRQNTDKTQARKTWIMLTFSLIMLISSAKLVVWGGSSLALAFGVSDLIIGLTVIALGTSLPELAVSITSALKGKHEMVLGNIIGSNLFNTLAVLAIPAMIHPANIPSDIMQRDYPIMLLLTVVLFFVSYKFSKTSSINRFEGGILVAIFGFYMWQLV